MHPYAKRSKVGDGVLHEPRGAYLSPVGSLPQCAPGSGPAAQLYDRQRLGLADGLRAEPGVRGAIEQADFAVSQKPPQPLAGCRRADGRPGCGLA